MTREVTISRAQRKSVIEYETLMAQAFRELGRILKDDARATVVFHSSASKVWNALGRAYVAAGFRIELASTRQGVARFGQATAQCLTGCCNSERGRGRRLLANGQLRRSSCLIRSACDSCGGHK